MPLELTDIDLQRTLFRFLTKSARKGVLADPEAARLRLSVDVGAVDLAEVAVGMQARIREMYPGAPSLLSLLGGASDTDLAAMQRFDWVTVGIYAFGLPPTKTRSGTPESSAHRALKEWAAANGPILGAPSDVVGVTERWFPSGDESDAAFVGESDALIVEVRPQGAESHELQLALFTLVKMRAVMQAEQHLNGRVGAVRVMLVTEAKPEVSIRELADELEVELFVR